MARRFTTQEAIVPKKTAEPEQKIAVIAEKPQDKPQEDAKETVRKQLKQALENLNMGAEELRMQRLRVIEVRDAIVTNVNMIRDLLKLGV